VVLLTALIRTTRDVQVDSRCVEAVLCGKSKSLIARLVDLLPRRFALIAMMRVWGGMPKVQLEIVYQDEFSRALSFSTRRATNTLLSFLLSFSPGLNPS